MSRLQQQTVDEKEKTTYEEEGGRQVRQVHVSIRSNCALELKHEEEGGQESSTRVRPFFLESNEVIDAAAI
uniref:Uncharacterized protein n=1 Tax=Musa acuminata subsp. malaccensis TaxID=214687 RepID=A0A804JAY3_MUSAM